MLRAIENPDEPMSMELARKNGGSLRGCGARGWTIVALGGWETGVLFDAGNTHPLETAATPAQVVNDADRPVGISRWQRGHGSSSRCVKYFTQEAVLPRVAWAGDGI
jgi:hypothetical protein